MKTFEETKQCNKCQKIKDFNDFYKTQKICKDCISQINRKYYSTDKGRLALRKSRRKYRLKNREKLLQINKDRRLKYKQKAIEILGNKCAHCGNSFHASVYDFHHVDPKTKDMEVANLIKMSWQKIEKELMKCILLCSNCHRIVHYANDI